MELLSAKLYHLCNPKDKNNLSCGYIGVTQNFDRRVKQHKSSGRFSDKGGFIAYVITEGDRESILEMEKWLRPECNIGWNSKAGGTDRPYQNSPTSKKCKQCDSTFMYYDHMGDEKGKFCSKKCHSDSMRVITQKCKRCDEDMLYKRKSKVCDECHSKTRLKELTCPTCVSKFKPLNYRSKFCSRDCFNNRNKEK